MKTLSLLLSLLLLSTTAHAEKCAELFAKNAPSTLEASKNVRLLPAAFSLKTKKSYRVGFFNIENLFYRWIKDPTIPTQKNQGGKFEQEAKSPESIKKAAKAILDMNADFLVLVEVESIEAMQRLSRESLGDMYESFLIEGNDARGIDVGLFVRRGLKVKVESRTHKDLTYDDPLTNQRTKLFSRDLPVWIVRDAVSNEVLTVVAGTHAKSMRPTDGDPTSSILRSAQHAKTAEILKGLQEEFGPETNIVFGGDMNSDVRVSPEVAPIKEVMQDAFDAAEISTPVFDRITHIYFPKDDPSGTAYHQLDGMFVSPGTKVRRAKVYLYSNENGRPYWLPNSYHEKKRNPSDHFPVYMDIER